MINKQSLWFLTLFSLILVLSVYYITMPNELLMTTAIEEEEGTKKPGEDISVAVEESELLMAMRVDLQEERLDMMKELQSKLTSADATIDERNSAYSQIKYLNQLQGVEEKLEEKIKTIFGLDNFVKVDNNQVKVVATADEHSTSLANNIMRSIQEEYTDKMYVTVKFE